jgi:16S rRNA G966 N2-methylase RsmD
VIRISGGGVDMAKTKAIVPQAEVSAKLTVLEKADRALERIETVQDAKEIIDISKAAKVWGEARGAPEVVRNAVIVRWKAERKAGQLLLKMKEREELRDGRPKKGNASPLEALKVDQKESHRWQRIGRMTDAEFVTFLNFTTERTERALLRAASESEAEVDRIEAARKAKEWAAGKTLPPSVRLECTDFREIDLEHDSVDLILTDPPYAMKDADLWSDLGVMAARILKPGSFLVSYVGHVELPRALSDLSKSLRYWWTASVSLTGPEAMIFEYRIKSAWRPVVVFQKSEFHGLGDWWIDRIEGGGREKSSHEWQQAESEFSGLIETFSEEKSTIFDPFLGSGTTGAAAVRLGRSFVGCDAKQDAVDSARARILEALDGR